MGILDPSPWIEEPMTSSAAWQGYGPQAAAQGNIGGLQRVLIGHAGGGPVQQPQPALPGVGALSAGASPAMSQEVQQALMSRVRTKDDMAMEEAARRAALEELLKVNSSPEDADTFSQRFMDGIAMAPANLPSDLAFNYGLANAVKARKDQRKATHQAAIENALAKLKFEQNESENADTAEKSALGDAAKILVAQSRAASKGSAQKRWQWTKDGLIDFQRLDENGIPTIVMPSSKDMTRFHDAAIRRATAKSMTMEFPGGAAERERWIQETAANELATLTGVDTIEPSSEPVTASTPIVKPKAEGGLDTERLMILNSELQSAIDSGDPARIKQAHKDLTEAMTNTTQIDTIEDLAADVAAAQTSEPTISTSGPVLKSPTQLEQEKAFVKENEKSAAKVMDSWRTEAIQANDAINAMSNIYAMKGTFNPGKFAGIREELGNYLGAFGFNGKLVQEAASLSEANRILQTQINDRMTEENGVQTEGDAQRFTKAYASTKDQPAAFFFSLGMVKENALRQQDRLRVANRHARQTRSNAGVQEAWMSYRDNVLGPMLGTIPDGRTMWRHEFIEGATQATLEANPGADPDIVRGMAEEKWLEFTKDGGGKK